MEGSLVGSSLQDSWQDLCSCVTAGWNSYLTLPTSSCLIMPVGLREPQAGKAHKKWVAKHLHNSNTAVRKQQQEA